MKWSKRVSLRSVSSTNYLGVHHPLLTQKPKNTWSLPPFNKGCNELENCILSLLPIYKFYTSSNFYNTQIIQNRICIFTQFTKFENGPKLQNIRQWYTNFVYASFVIFLFHWFVLTISKDTSLMNKFRVSYFQWW